MIDSLRLIDFAQATLHPTKVNELVETVIWAHHVHGKDVSDGDELAKIGASFGLGESMACGRRAEVQASRRIAQPAHLSQCRQQLQMRTI